MNIGVMLPQTRLKATEIVDAARVAEDVGLDGVFLRDHLFFAQDGSVPPHDKWVHSCFAMFGAVAAKTHRIRVGSLVVRNGVLPPSTLLRTFEGLKQIAGERLIAGIGVGDKLSAPENEVMDIDPPPFAKRVEKLSRLVDQLSDLEIETWLGGRSNAIRMLAEKRRVLVNQWEASVDDLVPGDSWGGSLVDRSQIEALRQADVSWAVFVGKGALTDPQGFMRDVARLTS